MLQAFSLTPGLLVTTVTNMTSDTDGDQQFLAQIAVVFSSSTHRCSEVIFNITQSETCSSTGRGGR